MALEHAGRDVRPPRAATQVLVTGAQLLTRSTQRLLDACSQAAGGGAGGFGVGVVLGGVLVGDGAASWCREGTECSILQLQRSI